jgi:hypothetical protein
MLYAGARISRSLCMDTRVELKVDVAAADAARKGRRGETGEPADSASPLERLNTRGLLALQRKVGNTAVRGLIQRDGPTKLPSPPSTLPPATKAHATPSNVKAFLAGTYTEPVFRPASGGGAQFFVQYAPKGGQAEQLFIGVKARADFKDSALMSGGQAQAAAGVNPFINALIQDINRKQQTPAGRSREVERWKWQAGETSPWALTLQKVLADTWSSAATKMTFVLDKPGWPALKASVIIAIEVVDGKGTQVVTGPVVPTADRHLDLTVWKRPSGLPESDEGASSKDNKHASMSLSSTSIGGRADNLLVFDWTPSVPLSNVEGWASDAVSAKTALGSGGSTAGKVPNASGQPITVEVRGPDAAQRNADAAAVTQRIVAGCGDAARVTRAPDRADPTRGVHLTLGGGKAQVVAAHEFGHLFGLPDEYATPFRAAGSKADDNDAAAKMGGPNSPTGALVENNDNIMSEGSVVRPQHYSAFLDALRKVTGLSEWRLA